MHCFETRTHARGLCAGGGTGPGKAAVGVAALMEQLVNMVPARPRQAKGAFLFAVDHCFALKGQGTVLTGTVLSGATQVCPCHPVIADVVATLLVLIMAQITARYMSPSRYALQQIVRELSVLREARSKWLLLPCRSVIP